MRFKLLASVIATTVILSSGMSAYADSVNMSFVQVTGGVGADGGKEIDNYWSINGLARSNHTTAGFYQFSVNYTEGNNPLTLRPNDIVSAVCIDITHGIDKGTATYSVEKVTTETEIKNGIGGMNENQIQAMTYLFAYYLDDAYAAGLGAEFQVAVWNILYDGAVTGLTNNATISYSNTNTNLSLASSWSVEAANFAKTNPGYDFGMELYAIIDSVGIAQSFGVVIPGDKGGHVVPLPAAVWVGGIMLGGMGGLKTLRRRKQVA